jgi:RNA polymerase sigma-70 factor, ECF subfamily
MRNAMRDQRVVTPMIELPAAEGFATTVILTFEAFFQAEYRTIARALILLTGDEAEAEELAEESFARAYERWSRISAVDSPAGYVYRTAVNLHRSQLRRARVRGRGVGRPEPSRDPASEADARIDIRRALAALPVAQREALLAVEWLGYDAEGAGRLLGIKPGAVRARLHRARHALRERIGGIDE